jgi:hypothetical protein
MRRLACLAIVVGAALAATPAFRPAPARAGDTEEAPKAAKGRQRHPLYDDHGALDWREKLADAQALAKRERKLVFIEYGRET